MLAQWDMKALAVALGEQHGRRAQLGLFVGLAHAPLHGPLERDGGRDRDQVAQGLEQDGLDPAQHALCAVHHHRLQALDAGARGLDAVEWAARAAESGAGEILLTSIDADGTREGYDLELTRSVAEAVGVPVIASGGAGEGSHLAEAFAAGAEAALIASIVHERPERLPELKRELKEAGWNVR